MYKSIIYLTILPILLFSQTWQPYHIEELNTHQNFIFNYEDIDRNAQNIPILPHERNLSHKIVGYLPYWKYSSYPNLDYTLLSEINFFSAELDGDGNIVNDHNWNNLDIVSFAHERGVKVKLCATLFGQNELTQLLSNPNNRANAISNLLALVLNKNADGIDIDFELLPTSQRNNLVLFMIELSTAFHDSMNDPIITMATPAIDWNDAWDYNSLAYLTDGLFIMGYNYFYSGSSNAGPVSPLGGYTYDIDYTVNDYINKTNGQMDKLILGLPYYGYDWPVIDNTMNSETTSNATASTYSTTSSLLQTYNNNWSTSSNSSWIAYQTNQWRQTWHDDSLSLSIKYQYAKDMQLNGIGIWALGYDDNHNELWGALYDKFYEDLFGDLNNDGTTNVMDVVLLINIILGLSEYSSDADINEDDFINVQDVIILVNIILNEF